jgi:hypothetical protein
MPDDQQTTATAQPDNTAELTRLQAENAALQKVLKEHQDKLSSYAEVDGKLADYESRIKGYGEFLGTHVKAKYEAAPEWVKGKVKLDDLGKVDPLQAIAQVDQLTAFYADIEREIVERHQQQNDPTRRAPQAQQGAPDFSSHEGMMAFINSLYKGGNK